MNRYEFEILITLVTPAMRTLARRLHQVRMPAFSSILIASATVSRWQSAASAMVSYEGKHRPVPQLWKVISSAMHTAKAFAVMAP